MQLKVYSTIANIDLDAFRRFYDIKERIKNVKNSNTFRILTADLLDEQQSYIKHPCKPWYGQEKQNKDRDHVLSGLDVKGSLENIIKGNIARRIFYEIEEDKLKILTDDAYDLD
jgi:hypothetical protein